MIKSEYKESAWSVFDNYVEVVSSDNVYYPAHYFQISPISQIVAVVVFFLVFCVVLRLVGISK